MQSLLDIDCLDGFAGAGVVGRPTCEARTDTTTDREPGGHMHRARTLYIWAGDQARIAPDFLAVVDFDEHSKTYGKVLKTVPIPPPGNVGNEPHHCHLSHDKNILACGGLLSLLRAQNGIFFFDVSDDRNPKFLFSTDATLSSITDDFYPLREGGFLVTQMGSAGGGGARARRRIRPTPAIGQGVAGITAGRRLQSRTAFRCAPK
jgi:selenium-binding protein 1